MKDLLILIVIFGGLWYLFATSNKKPEKAKAKKAHPVQKNKITAMDAILMLKYAGIITVNEFHALQRRLKEMQKEQAEAIK